jgi:hypothetical protein
MQNEPVHANYSMKTHIMFRRVLTPLAFAAALALPPGPAQAQSNDAPQPRQMDPRRGRVAADDAKAQSPAGMQYDLEIENGALRLRQPGNQKGEYAQEAPLLGRIVKLLRDKHPEANIAMAPELGDVEITDLKLHGADLEEELAALRVASGGKFDWRGGLFGGAKSPSLYTLEASPLFLKEKTESTSPQVEVFNFSSYFARQRDSGMDDAKFQAFKDQTIETTKEIIGNTLTSLGPHSMMSFQFHPGANLLVITGSTDEISISRKIINAMIEQPDVINRFGPGPPRTRAVPAPQPMIPVPAPPGNAPQIPPVPRPQPIQ